MTFASPGSAGDGDRFSVKDNDGALVVITPRRLESGVRTQNGDRDVVVVDVSVLDGPNAGQESAGAFIFGKVLIGQLRSKLNEQVLGRLAKGQAKPGQNAPWVLKDPTPSDLEAGQAWAAKANAAPY